MHLLYLYLDDPLDGTELRLSLRSVEKYLHVPQMEVTVVGDRPSWLTGAHHIPAENPYPSKAANMAHKTWLGCKELRGESSVVYMEDDYVLLDHQDSVLPVYWGDLSEHITRVERYHYPGFWMSEAMRTSLRFLGTHPAPRSWELHRPTPLVPDDVAPLIEPLVKAGAPALVRSVWGTLTLEGWQGGDARLTGTSFPSRHDSPWVSLDDAVPTSLAATLSTPSRWEKS